MSKLLKYFLLGAVIFISSLIFEATADKLAHLRSSKKIVPVSEVSAPFFAVQILAIKRAPQNPSFFKNIERAREFECRDGYVRYTVGAYSSKREARADMERIKSKGYPESFVVDIRDYDINGEYVSNRKVSFDPNTTYTIQIAALRYPVYANHFDEFDNVMEFYPDDRVYRYTVGKYKGSEAKEVLRRIQAIGYKQAHLVPLEKYSPYRIE